MAKEDNLNKKGRWVKGVSGNPKGRPPKLKNVIKSIPPEAQQEVYGVLYHAISLQSIEEVKEYLQSKTLGEYGLIFQLALKQITGKFGWQCLCDILDRLFGYPAKSAKIDTSIKSEGIKIEVADQETAEALNRIIGGEDN